MKKDENHIRIRDSISTDLKKGLSEEEIAKKHSIQLGSRYLKGTLKWYIFCINSKDNQKIAIEKHPNLYSIAGKIAQQKHPDIGKNLGNKYGKICGKLRMENLRKEGKLHEFFSNAAKRLHEINPNQSRLNLLKAHQTMKNKGTFNEHQRLAAISCRNKNPNQLKEMSKKAHELYPLGLLALESRRRNYPYRFMDCAFDSEQERQLCELLVKNKLIEKPIENENIHFKINKKHIDFFIQKKIFIEFHPPRKFGKVIETEEGYYASRRKLLDENGFNNYPLILITNLKNISKKIEEINSMLQTH